MKEEKAIFILSLVFLLTLSAYFLADTVDAVIERSLSAAPSMTTPLEQARPAIEPRRELSDYNAILERGLFGEGRGPSGAAPSASSEYRLIGTVEGESFSGAVLEDNAKVQAFYRLREKMPDGAMIVKVQREKITIRQADGVTIELQVADETKIVSVPPPAGGGVRRMSEGKFMVDQGMVTSSTENLNDLLTKARALPYLEQGKMAGFRLSEIVPGSLFEKIGLQNGDVIQRVNTQDIDDPGKFFQMYQNLKNERSIAVDVIRGGQRQTLNYDIR
jgi:general secretion pathway protein C